MNWSERAQHLGWIVGGALLLSFGLPNAGTTMPAVPTLRVEESFEVPAEPSTATDVRWASDQSVYLARQYSGVAEVQLTPGLRLVRQVVPNRETMGLGTYRNFSRLAVSHDYLAFDQWVGPLAWRSLASPPDGKVRFEWKRMAFAEDLDLFGDRLLVLGALDTERPDEEFAPDGAVAFLASAREDHRQTFRPVLFDPAGAGVPHLLHCSKLNLGGVRFLADGSFFILPGFQPGAFLYGPSGNLLHTWNTSLLGLDADSDCGDMTMAKLATMRKSAEERVKWLSHHRVVDAVVALPEGPGVVIRSVEAGKVTWELDELGSAAVTSYALPITARSPRERVRADYRSGRLVVLVTEENLRLHEDKSPSRLIVLAFPYPEGGVR